MKQDKCLHEIEQRFHNAMNEETPQPDIQQFRKAFENAWEQRSVWNRLFGKPLNAVLFSTLIVVAGLGTGYSLMMTKARNTPEQQPNPILMPGQRIVHEPDLIALFPKVKQPTLISNEPKNEAANFNYVLHGYLPGNIQVVWEY